MQRLGVMRAVGSLLILLAMLMSNGFIVVLRGRRYRRARVSRPLLGLLVTLLLLSFASCGGSGSATPAAAPSPISWTAGPPAYAYPPAPVTAAPTEKTVRVLYLVPRDRTPRDDYQRAIERSVLDMQAWYYGHLKGKTFRLNSLMVEVKQTPHDSDWYDRTVPASRPERRFYTWYNAFDDAAAFGVKADDPEYVWLVHIDAPGGWGAATKGAAILPKHYLEALVGRPPADTPVDPRSSVRNWNGDGAHELGHAFGLAHSGDPHPNALMQFGFLHYPACYLTPEDTQILDRSPFLRAGKPPAFAGRGRFIYAYDGGYFVNVGGKSWEERKTGADVIFPFTEKGMDQNFLYLVRDPGLWIALPREGKGNGILMRWQSDSFEKLYEALE